MTIDHISRYGHFQFTVRDDTEVAVGDVDGNGDTHVLRNRFGPTDTVQLVRHTSTPGFGNHSVDHEPVQLINILARASEADASRRC